MRHSNTFDPSLIFHVASLNDNDDKSIALENNCSTGMRFSAMLKMLLKPGPFIVLIFTAAEIVTKNVCVSRARRR
ncbi:hypothetical protein [uncultured Gimesia sp.]|uniref:hypothetical protein n=1 Tax=uncultured Gimesia sp. TaxID=1678688 RepID=UPI0030DBA86F